MRDELRRWRTLTLAGAISWLVLSACSRSPAPADATGPAPAPVASVAPDAGASRVDTAPVAAEAPEVSVAIAAESPDSRPAATPEPTPDAVAPPAEAEDARGGSEGAAAASNDRPRGSEFALPGGEDSLFDRVARVVGQGLPVAIIPTIEGLAAVSADGERWTLLHKGRVPWAVVDERARVIWFGQSLAPDRGGDDWVAVYALDLFASNLAPTRVSARLPGDSVFVVSHPGRGPEGRDEKLWSAIGRGAITTLVVDTRRPRLEASGGVYMELGLIDAGPHRAAVKAGALDKEAVAFVRGLAKRSGERSNRRPLSVAPELPERLEVPSSGCELPEQCGTWSPWPNPSWVAVVVEHACGDSCLTRMALWNVEKRALVEWGDGAGAARPGLDGRFESPIIAPDGSAWTEGGLLMRPGSKPWTWPVPDGEAFAPWGGGWLGGQYTLY